MQTNRQSLIVSLLLLWLAAVIFATRYFMLDDALIHLNYARYLHDRHFITFDGINPSFGTSSLLYVSLLAFLRSFTSTGLLSKIVSVCAFIVLIGSLLWVFFRMKSGTIGRALIGGVIAACSTVMAVRWLTDGMETSLTLWAVLMLCLVVWAEMQRPSTTVLRGCALVFLGLVLTLLRIELAMILVLSCLAILLARRGGATRAPFIAQFLGASFLGWGAVLAELIIYACFKSFLPDTALAKSKPHMSIGPLLGVMHVLASSFDLGVGILLLWFLSAAVALYHARKHPSATRTVPIWCVINCAFPALITLACLRSQSMQGVRYVLWAIVFSFFLNTLQLADLPRSRYTWFRKSAVAVACILLLLFPFDTWLGLRSLLSRTHNFIDMRNAHVESFAGQTIVAGDVGFVGYFTQGRICDTSGLVNGRGPAALDEPRRTRLCAESHPAGIFMNDGQAVSFNRDLPIGNWVICSAIDFQNVSRHDWHYLATPNPALCPHLPSPAQTMQDVVPELRQ